MREPRGAIAIEQDSRRLLALLHELNVFLAAKQAGLDQKTARGGLKSFPPAHGRYHRLSGNEYGVLGVKGPGHARGLVKDAMR
jgi:hypothetical protein